MVAHQRDRCAELERQMHDIALPAIRALEAQQPSPSQEQHSHLPSKPQEHHRPSLPVPINMSEASLDLPVTDPVTPRSGVHLLPPLPSLVARPVRESTIEDFIDQLPYADDSFYNGTN